ncbi:MAG: bifunctional riboflavin kinase/FAD synthetase [Hyphomicrobiaceae bacterium]|nr:bifunctional riboflavin kinase/FAD synthetase [Hyphomicrobiaceae bacterium]
MYSGFEGTGELGAMQVLRQYDEMPASARRGVVAIGNFDGVHRGHKALLRATTERARSDGRQAGVVLFEPHPRELFQPDEPHFRLTPLHEKLRLIAREGLDFSAVLTFDKALAGLSAAAFIEDLLVGWLHIGHVVVGYDFCFGRGRSGTTETLQTAGLALGFGTTVLPEQGEAGAVFSSTAIRRSLAQGDVAGAARALGHWWRVSGRVEPGARIGRDLGFPTINIDLPRGAVLMHGIYAARVTIGDGQHPHDGAAYFGTRPTVDAGAPRLEVFLIDFDGDLYGREVSVELIGYIRADQAFASLEEMRTQMVADCAQARAILAAAPAVP